MVVRQKLEAVRRRARRLLLARRLGQALLAAAGGAVGLALLDWTLRLPGWLRLAIVVVVAVAAAWWLVTRVGRAWRFAPPLAELALRAEERFPALRGVLASGLELAGAGGGGGGGGGALADGAVRAAEDAAGSASFDELVEPRPARRAVAAGLAAAVVVAVLAALMPATAATAASRWLNPLGDTAWPLRYAVELQPLPPVLPADAPIAVSAIVRGPDPDARAWARVRFEDAGTGRVIAEEDVLLSPSGDEAGTEEGSVRVSARLELPAAVLARLESGSTTEVNAIAEVSAGDALSEAQTRPVRLRPGIASAAVRVTPPAYAAGLVAERAEALNPAPGGDALGRVAALRGSRVSLDLGFNRPLPRAEVGFSGEPLPGQAWSFPEGDGEAPTASLAFDLQEDARPSIELRDGPAREPATLTDSAPRTLELVATPDEAPRARVSEPAADFSVLATAELPVAAAGSDDLTLVGLALEAELERMDTDAPPQPDARTLAEAGSVGRELEARGSLALASFGAAPGDTLVLHAVARAPGLDGVVETRSAPRRLRVVTASELLGEVRREVAAVRREARGLAEEQARLRAEPGDSPEQSTADAARQARLARAAAAAQRRLEAVADRLDLNNAGEEDLEAAVAAAGERLASATAAAEAAQASLEASPADPAAAADEQAAAEEDLRAAADLLDAGGDAAALRLDAKALADAQRALRAEAARLLPLTAGQKPEDLEAPLKEEVDALTREQEALAERADELVEKLRAASEDPGSTAAEQAAAAAMAQAAEAAAKAGLTPAMEAAAAAAGQNQLAGAGESQDDALAALEQVLDAFEGQADIRRELLKARLAELLDRVKRIRDDTAAAEAQLAETNEAAAVVALAEPLSDLWERIARRRGREPTRRRRPARRARRSTPRPPRSSARSRSCGPPPACRPRPPSGRRSLRSTSPSPSWSASPRPSSRTRRDEKKAKMRALYTALADRQDALADEVEPLAADAPDRRARATLRGFVVPQQDLAAEARDLEERAGEGAVFAAVHAEVDAGMTRSAVRLGTGEALPEVPADQRRAAASLRAMADALVPPPPGNDFQEGGGGGGGGGSPPDVPDAAQVKLLRGMQAQLLAESDAAREAGPDAEPGTGTRLADRQRTLLALGRALAEQVQRQQPVPAPAPAPPGDAP